MSRRHRTRSLQLTGPLIVWLALQWVVLAMGAAGVPLAANWPTPREKLAVDEMVVAQLVFATLLFPYLLRSPWAAAAVIVTSLPMLQIAGFLSTTSIDRLAMVAAFVAMWVMALTLVRLAIARLAPGGRWNLVATAVASLYVIGGAVMWYLRLDFRDQAARGLALTPIPAALTILHRDNPGFTQWLTVVIPLVLSIVVIVIIMTRRPSASETHAEVT